MSSRDQQELLGEVWCERYQILEFIGRGGMGNVFKARQLQIDREVALKVIHRHLCMDEKQVQRFEQEARNSSRLSHPNSIRVFDYGKSADGRLFMSMELLRGLTLADLLAEHGTLPPERVVHITRQILKSLAEAHQLGLVHRDLKPENIFICDIYGEADFVKVLDFGIAKAIGFDQERENLTQTGFICGTPRYISPEQALGQPVDARADLYAVGVLLYEMLAGRPPFLGDSPITIVMKHVYDDPPPLVGLDRFGNIGRRLTRLTEALLQKSPARRPASSEKCIAFLDERIDEAELLARSRPPGPPPGATTAPIHPPEGAAAQPPPRRPTGSLPSFDEAARLAGRAAPTPAPGAAVPEGALETRMMPGGSRLPVPGDHQMTAMIPSISTGGAVPPIAGGAPGDAQMTAVMPSVAPAQGRALPLSAPPSAPPVAAPTVEPSLAEPEPTRLGVSAFADLDKPDADAVDHGQHTALFQRPEGLSVPFHDASGQDAATHRMTPEEVAVAMEELRRRNPNALEAPPRSRKRTQTRSGLVRVERNDTGLTDRVPPPRQPTGLTRRPPSQILQAVEPPPPPSRWPLYVSIGAIVVLLASGAAWFVAGQRQTAAEPPQASNVEVDRTGAAPPPAASAEPVAEAPGPAEPATADPATAIVAAPAPAPTPAPTQAGRRLGAALASLEVPPVAAAAAPLDLPADAPEPPTDAPKAAPTPEAPPEPPKAAPEPPKAAPEPAGATERPKPKPRPQPVDKPKPKPKPTFDPF